MSKKSRTKGATFENAVCRAIKDELGLDVRRNLSQYQESDLGDIELEPFLIECKRYASGNWFQKPWWEQTKTAAAKQNMIPVLIWKYDRQPIRVTVPMYMINSEWAVDSGQFSWPVEGNAMYPMTCELEVGMSLMREWLL
tara:strand:- start:203 stop:622 length:420 start_codon:yes stop_codon:yes gene_type:complete